MIGATLQMIIPVKCIRADCGHTWWPRKVGPVQACPRCKARQLPIQPRRPQKVKV